MYSEVVDSENIDILLSTSTADETEQYSFNNVIIESISFELREAEFGIIISDDINNKEQLLLLAKQKKASFLIKSSYLRVEKSLTLNINCYRTKEGTLLHSISKTSKIDLDLDSVIREIAKELIIFIKQDIKNNPDLVYFNTENKLKIVEKKDDSLLTNGNEKSGQVHTKKEVLDNINYRHFSFSTEALTFMTTGDASSYFINGLGAGLHAAYNLQTSFGYLGLGLGSAAVYFEAEGILLRSENFFISAGPEIILDLSANQLLDIFFRLNSGATLFMMNRNNEGYKSTIIPFVSGGMGMTINFTPGFGIILSTTYSLYIESSILITGFSPSAGIYLGL